MLVISTALTTYFDSLPHSTIVNYFKMIIQLDNIARQFPKFNLKKKQPLTRYSYKLFFSPLHSCLILETAISERQKKGWKICLEINSDARHWAATTCHFYLQGIWGF